MARTRRKKRRTHVREDADPTKKGPPKSFVFWRGQYGLTLKGLEGDLRKMMQPYTATKLQESKRNQLKDFVSIAGPLGVSQFLILTATENSSYLRIAKVPRGPTMTMRIHSYSLIRDVVSTQLRPRLPDSLWKGSPLVVMNNFAGKEHLKLATALFQNLFPAINVKTARLSNCQRVVLLSYDKETDRLHLRHYSIRVQPSGVTKSVKQLVSRRSVPDLGDCQDVAEFLTKAGYGSESEGEEAASSRVVLAQDMGRGNMASRQSRVLLQEIGPRLELEIVKVEDGMCGGNVLFHSRVKKSPTEAAAQEKAVKAREDLRKQRRNQQEANVKRKASMKRRKEAAEGVDGGGAPKRRKKEWWDKEPHGERKYEEDDDAEYYRQEVGQEPDDLGGAALKGGKSRKHGDSRPRTGTQRSPGSRSGGKVQQRDSPRFKQSASKGKGKPSGDKHFGKSRDGKKAGVGLKIKTKERRTARK